MENKAKQTKKKKAPQMVFKPYLKGRAASGEAAKRGLKVLAYYLIFVFFYLIIGSALIFDNAALRVITNLILVAATVALLYMEGARAGDADVAFAEIAYMRKESGKNVDESDLDRCYHAMKGAFTAMIGVMPVFLIALAYALLAQKQVYALQVLPGWVSAYSGVEEIALPLSYYNREVAFTVADVLRIIVRLVCFPFVNIATTDNTSALLLVDRLSPLFTLLPACGYFLGYLQGPRSRAMVHGNIATNTRRHIRRQKKAIRERREKNNQII